jgi:hypothetical protein
LKKKTKSIIVIAMVLSFAKRVLARACFQHQTFFFKRRTFLGGILAILIILNIYSNRSRLFPNLNDNDGVIDNNMENENFNLKNLTIVREIASISTLAEAQSQPKNDRDLEERTDKRVEEVLPNLSKVNKVEPEVKIEHEIKIEPEFKIEPEIQIEPEVKIEPEEKIEPESIVESKPKNETKNIVEFEEKKVQVEQPDDNIKEPELEDVAEKEQPEPKPKIENGCFFMLTRTEDLKDVIRSIRGIESVFNQHYLYPYVILTDTTFSEDFKQRFGTNESPSRVRHN